MVSASILSQNLLERGGEGVGREENDFTTSTSRAKFFDRQEVGDFPLPCAARLVL